MSGWGSSQRYATTLLKAGLICLLIGVVGAVVGVTIIPFLSGVDSLAQVGGITGSLTIIFLAGGVILVIASGLVWAFEQGLIRR